MRTIVILIIDQVSIPRFDTVKQMGAGKFKAECLTIMDHVFKTGESVLITKHGKPVAKLVPAKKK